MAVSSSLDAGGVAAIMILAPSLSSRCLSPGSSHLLAPAQLVSWIPGTRPGMTSSLGRLADNDAGLDVKLQDVVEAVEGAAQRGAPGHLDDLRLAEVRSEPRENLVARAVPVVGDGDGVFHHQLVHVIELGMRLVVEEPRGSRLRHALH